MVRATLALAALAATANAVSVTIACAGATSATTGSKTFVRYLVNGEYVSDTLYCINGAANNAPVSATGICAVSGVNCVYSVPSGSTMLFQNQVGAAYTVTTGSVTGSITNQYPAGTTYTTLETKVSTPFTVTATTTNVAQGYLLIDGAELMGVANGTVVSQLDGTTETVPSTFNWAATNTSAYWIPPTGATGSGLTAASPQVKTSVGIVAIGPVVDGALSATPGATSFTASILSADTTFGSAQTGLNFIAATNTNLNGGVVAVSCLGQKTCTVASPANAMPTAVFPLVGGLRTAAAAAVCRSRCVFPANSNSAVACAAGTINNILPAGVATCGANFFPIVTQACDGTDNGIIYCSPGANANVVVTDVDVATTIALIGTNTTAFGLYIAQLNAAGYATVFSKTCVACVARPIFKGRGGFITCGACALAGAVVGVSTTRQAVSVGSSSAVAVGVCNPGTAAQQAACLAEMNCQGFSFTNVVCSQGTCPTCPVDNHSSSKKGLLGLLGLLALIPIVLLLLCSSCLLCAMLMKRRKTVAVPTPMPTVAPLATVCEPAVVCGGSTFVGHTSPYGADPFCAAPVADPFCAPGVGSAYPVM